MAAWNNERLPWNPWHLEANIVRLFPLYILVVLHRLAVHVPDGHLDRHAVEAAHGGRVGGETLFYAAVASAHMGEYGIPGQTVDPETIASEADVDAAAAERVLETLVERHDEMHHQENHGQETRGGEPLVAMHDSDTPWRDPDVLEELFVEEGLSTQAMADELGCSAATVKKWRRRHGIHGDIYTGAGETVPADEHPSVSGSAPAQSQDVGQGVAPAQGEADEPEETTEELLEVYREKV